MAEPTPPKNTGIILFPPGPPGPLWIKVGLPVAGVLYTVAIVLCVKLFGWK